MPPRVEGLLPQQMRALPQQVPRRAASPPPFLQRVTQGSSASGGVCLHAVFLALHLLAASCAWSARMYLRSAARGTSIAAWGALPLARSTADPSASSASSVSTTSANFSISVAAAGAAAVKGSHRPWAVSMNSWAVARRAATAGWSRGMVARAGWRLKSDRWMTATCRASLTCSPAQPPPAPCHSCPWRQHAASASLKRFAPRACEAEPQHACLRLPPQHRRQIVLVAQAAPPLVEHQVGGRGEDSLSLAGGTPRAIDARTPEALSGGAYGESTSCAARTAGEAKRRRLPSSRSSCRWPHHSYLDSISGKASPNIGLKSLSLALETPEAKTPPACSLRSRTPTVSRSRTSSSSRDHA
eukprot:scaffold30358_cov65-Phaeocystis_antarctica.AAC.5